MESKRLTGDELEQKMKNIQDWILQSVDVPEKPDMLFKMHPFGVFKEAKDFVDRVSEIAEGVKHYPTINFTTQYVSIMLWTPEAGGLTDQDFELAKKIDELGQLAMEKDRF